MHSRSWIGALLLALTLLASGGGARSATPRVQPPIQPVAAAAAVLPTNTLSPADEAAAAQIDRASIGLQLTYASLRARTLTDADLKARISDIEGIRAQLSAALGRLSSRLKDFDSRLAQLGPPPAPGQPPEDPETAANRATLTASHASIDAEIKQAKLLSVEAGQIEGTLSARLRGNFSARLWARDRSIARSGAVARLCRRPAGGCPQAPRRPG